MEKMLASQVLFASIDLVKPVNDIIWHWILIPLMSTLYNLVESYGFVGKVINRNFATHVWPCWQPSSDELLAPR